jgi:hypothetical protein
VRKKWKRGVTALMALVVSAISVSAINAISSAGSISDSGKLEVGDTVAMGVRGPAGGCKFDTINIHTIAPGDGKTQWVGVILDAQKCRTIVNAR